MPSEGAIRRTVALTIDSVVRREAGDVPLPLFWSMMRRSAGEIPPHLFDAMDRLAWQIGRAIELARAQMSPRTPLAQHVADGGVVETLIEYARQGNREDFEWLARSTGVAVDDIPGLWQGTRSRLPLQAGR